MDRGFAFKQINNYMNCFVPGDPKVGRVSLLLPHLVKREIE